jgi:hypothetical protein
MIVAVTRIAPSERARCGVGVPKVSNGESAAFDCPPSFRRFGRRGLEPPRLPPGPSGAACVQFLIQRSRRSRANGLVKPTWNRRLPGFGLVGGEALLHHIALGRRGWSRFDSGST